MIIRIHAQIPTALMEISTRQDPCGGGAAWKYSVFGEMSNIWVSMVSWRDVSMVSWLCHGEMPPDDALMVTGEHNRQRRHANKISQENLRRTPHPMLAR